jgi:hypothetical protein
MRVRSSSRFSRVISDAWSASDGSGGGTGGDAARDRALPPRTAARQFRSIDGEIPTSVATCISGRPLLSSRATVSRLNSGENSLLVFGIAHLHAPTGLAKVSTESRDHHLGYRHRFRSGVTAVVSVADIFNSQRDRGVIDSAGLIERTVRRNGRRTGTLALSMPFAGGRDGPDPSFDFGN